MEFVKYLTTHPEKFIDALKKTEDYLSLETAEKIDHEDPLNETKKLFDISGPIPLGGHSLGPIFKPAVKAMNETANYQAKYLHDGHFPNSHPDGEKSGHWFDCDRFEPALLGAQQILGFKELCEFNFTASGLSDNLRLLLQTFYRPTKKDWESNSTKVFILGTEFFSDQAIVHSLMDVEILRAKNNEFFENKEIPSTENQILKIFPDTNNLYNTQKIIDAIKDNAQTIKMICLSDIVFSTGQRLEIEKILTELRSIIKEKNIKVILDLAHSAGNRQINLEPIADIVTAAVGCDYKHLCGFPGSPFGFYVSRHVNLEQSPPIQGWKSAEADKVFAVINGYDPKIMTSKKGALAFRASNPPPMALLPAQTYLTYFGKIGFEKLFNKSECLTQYLILQLQHHLKDQIEIITPLDPAQRGATIAFRLTGNMPIKSLENYLKEAGYEVDTRPPNIMRVTPHYAYTTFKEVCTFVKDLKLILNNDCYPSKAKNASKQEEIFSIISPEDKIISSTLSKLEKMQSSVTIMNERGFGPGFQKNSSQVSSEENVGSIKLLTPFTI